MQKNFIDDLRQQVYYTIIHMKTATTISISTPLYEAAKREADNQRRTFSGQIEVVLEEHFHKHTPPLRLPRAAFKITGIRKTKGGRRP